MLTLLTLSVSMKTKMFWTTSVVLHIVLSIMALMVSTPSSMPMMTSSFSLHDSLSTSMVSLTLWITAVMLLASTKIEPSSKKTFQMMVIILCSISLTASMPLTY